MLVLSAPLRWLDSGLRAALIGAVAILCLVSAPLTRADAATRHAAPDGDGPSPCLQTDPCDLETAVDSGAGLLNGDTVLLAPGTYHPSGSLEVFPEVTLSGEPGQPAPLIEATGERGLWLPNSSTVRDIRIHSSAGTQYGFVMGEGTAERVESSGEADRACVLEAVTLRDSLCSAFPPLGGGYGIEMFIAASTPVTVESQIVNVTTTGGAAGVGMAANESGSVTLTATNSIVAGDEEDIYANSLAPTAGVHVVLSHSNFSEVTTEGTAEVTSPTEAGNQSAAPLFLNAVAGDYREAAGSPTRGAGDTAVVLAGETDLAGGAQITDCEGIAGVDIGAYQVQCPPPPTPEPVAAAPVAPRVAPQLSGLTLTHKRFAVAGARAPKGTPRGTVIGFRLSEPAAVTISVLAKRSRKGKKARLVTLGKLKVSGKKGKNKVSFSGKLGGKPLSPGKYRLQVAAKGGSGLSSAPLVLPFEIVG
jgi:hypothetical protein